MAGNVVAEQRVVVVIAEKQAGRRGRRRLFVRRWGDDVQGDDGRRGRDHRDGGIKLVEHGLETLVGVDQLGADPVRFGDVGHRSHPACLLALVVDQRRDIEPNIDDPAILAPCPRLQARRGGATRDRQVQVGHVEVMFLGDPVRVGGQLSHHFFGRITEDLAQCPVHVGDATIVVDHAQPRADGVLDGATERGFGGQRLLHQLATSNVVGHRVIERFGRAGIHTDGPAQPAPGIAKAHPAFQGANAFLGRGEGLDHVQPVLRVDMVPEARIAQVLAEIFDKGRVAAHQGAVRADHAEHVLRQLEQPVALALGAHPVMGAAPEQDQRQDRRQRQREQPQLGQSFGQGGGVVVVGHRPQHQAVTGRVQRKLVCGARVDAVCRGRAGQQPAVRPHQTEPIAVAQVLGQHVCQQRLQPDAGHGHGHQTPSLHHGQVQFGHHLAARNQQRCRIAGLPRLHAGQPGAAPW